MRFPKEILELISFSRKKLKFNFFSGDLQAVKIIPELTYMTGITDEQRSNYSMMNVSYTNFVFLIDFFLKLAPTHKIFL